MRQFLDKTSTLVLRYIPFVLALFIPLFFLPITADPFTLNKFYLVTFIASLSLIAWCVRSLVRGKLSFTDSPSLLPLIFLVLAQIISSFWLSPVRHVSLFGQTAFFISLLIIKTGEKGIFIHIKLINSCTRKYLWYILHYQK